MILGMRQRHDYTLPLDTIRIVQEATVPEHPEWRLIRENVDDSGDGTMRQETRLYQRQTPTIERRLVITYRPPLGICNFSAWLRDNVARVDAELNRVRLAGLHAG